MPSNSPSNTKSVTSEPLFMDVSTGLPTKKAPPLTAADLAVRGITPAFLQRLRGSKDLTQR